MPCLSMVIHMPVLYGCNHVFFRLNLIGYCINLSLQQNCGITQKDYTVWCILLRHEFNALRIIQNRYVALWEYGVKLPCLSAEMEKKTHYSALRIEMNMCKKGVSFFIIRILYNTVVFCHSKRNRLFSFPQFSILYIFLCKTLANYASSHIIQPLFSKLPLFLFCFQNSNSVSYLRILFSLSFLNAQTILIFYLQLLQ